MAAGGQEGPLFRPFGVGASQLGLQRINHTVLCVVGVIVFIYCTTVFCTVRGFTRGRVTRSEGAEHADKGSWGALTLGTPPPTSSYSARVRASAMQVLPWYENSVHGVGHVGLLTFTTGLGLYCFAGCVLVDPGRVPEGWHLARAEGGGDTAVVEVKKVSACA